MRLKVVLDVDAKHQLKQLHTRRAGEEGSQNYGE